MSKLAKFFLVMLLLGVATGASFGGIAVIDLSKRQVQEFWDQYKGPRSLEEAQAMEINEFDREYKDPVGAWHSAEKTAENIGDLSWLGGMIIAIGIFGSIGGITVVIRYKPPKMVTYTIPPSYIPPQKLFVPLDMRTPRPVIRRPAPVNQKG